MVIAQIMPEFGLAGAEIMCENLVSELFDLGHKVIVISMYDYQSAIIERFKAKGIRLYFLNKQRGLDFSMIFKLKRIFKKEKVEVVHTHRYCAQYAVPAAILSGVKHRVHTVHSIASKENKTLARFFNRIFFKFNNLIPVALSEEIKKTIVKEYHLKEGKVPVVLNGVDLSRYKTKDNYKLKDCFTIIHIGRFSEVKNHRTLLEAFSSFHDKYQNTRLILIGIGELMNEMIEYVKNNNLNQCVLFLGEQPSVNNFLFESDVFALPSFYEGIPMSLIEAMATALPIVASSVGGITDMLSDGKSALFIDPLLNDAATLLADVFCQLFEDEDLRIRLGKNAKEESKKFGSDIMAKEYLKLYGR